ncbi:MAG: CDP-diacylglycerol--glycerol-3-phosphate 3-phosphatidyltransferase [Planctomycetota bacterium]|nr:CDP-diacylglycerol--glycerol-3-phosphate 3-phosphatidyltransferase [Planctomycetota bacterium]
MEPNDFMRINLPNQITLARLVIAVVFCVLLARYECRRGDEHLWMLDWAFGLFLIGALSDILDGYLARRNNQVTPLGRVLDPFVDKILVGGGFVLFLDTGFIHEGENITGVAAWMVVVIVSRELLVSGLRGFSEASGKAYGANFWGKSKMVVQSITICWVIVSIGRGREVDFWVSLRPIMLWITIVITVLSVVAYLPASRHALAEQSRE